MVTSSSHFTQLKVKKISLQFREKLRKSRLRQKVASYEKKSYISSAKSIKYIAKETRGMHDHIKLFNENLERRGSRRDLAFSSFMMNT